SLTPLAWADSTAAQKLMQDLSAYQQAQGSFSQNIMDQHGASLQQSSGTFALIRPVAGNAAGKFRWQTISPSSQLLIADGQKIWFYD
ncbi:outer-membrane lipoprotein carrier protein LolA, partial [Acinetobacter baumannii]